MTAIIIDRAVVEQVLEALEYGQHSLKQVSEHEWVSRGELAMQALRAALEQEQAEPVAWLYVNKSGVQALHIEPSLRLDADIKAAQDYPDTNKVTPLYAAPPKRKPLTDEQDRALCEAYCNDASNEYFKARPVLDFPEMRRIFYANHAKRGLATKPPTGSGKNDA